MYKLYYAVELFVSCIVIALLVCDKFQDDIWSMTRCLPRHGIFLRENLL